MKHGKTYEFGEIVLASVSFPNGTGIKQRPVLILFQKRKNIIVTGITSNLSREGVLIKKEEGLDKDSIVRLDYIFTIDDSNIKKKLITISESKKKEICKKLEESICGNFTLDS